MMTVQNDPAIQALIDRILPTYTELRVAATRASWELNTTGTTEAAKAASDLLQKLRTYMADPDRFAELRDWKEAGGASDPVLNRQLHMLYQQALGNQASPEEIQELVDRETELRQLFNNFRATYQGREVTDNDLALILQREPDTALRKAAWLATKEIGALAAEKIRALAKLRNRVAHRLGFRDYCAMALSIQEIDEDELLQTLEYQRSITDATFRAEKQMLDAKLAERFGIHPHAIMPWHYPDPYFSSAPRTAENTELDRYFENQDVAQISIAFYDAIGLEVRDILARSDLYERPGKMQHAFSSHIDQQGDVRILCNLKNNQRWMSTQLHELGHATYDKYLDPGLAPLLRRPAHSMVTEAVAQLMGRLVNNADWLSAFVGVPADEAQKVEAHVRHRERQNQLIFARWGAVVFHFERALYGNPDQDLGTVWWQLVNRLQGVPTPQEGDRSTDWAAKIHIANYPMYYHNYVLGEMIASQLQAGLVRDLGSRWMLSNETGAWLWKRLFRPGNSLPWNDRLEQATGERLNPEHFVHQFAQG